MTLTATSLLRTDLVEVLDIACEAGPGAPAVVEHHARHSLSFVRFYAAVMGALGHRPIAEDGTGYASGDEALWLSQDRAAPGGAHVAFRAADRETVHRFHAAGLAAGGQDNGAPGPRPDYGPAYYAAFLIDPDGNNVEAVCLAPA